MKLRLALMSVVAAGGLLVSQIGSAAATYYLNHSNVSNVYQTYASVTIEQDGNNVKFTVSVGPNFVGDGWALDEFGFNYTGAIAPALTFNGLTDVDPDTAGNQTWTSGGSGNLDGFGSFDYTVGGNGQSNRSQPVVFTISAADASALNYLNFIATTGDVDCSGGEDTGCYFAVHMVGLSGSAAALKATFYASGGGGDSNTLVPIPAAVWLLGSGLLGLFGIGRRRRAS